MKKLFAILLIVTLSLGLTACGGNGTAADGVENQGAAVVEPQDRSEEAKAAAIVLFEQLKDCAKSNDFEQAKSLFRNTSEDEMQRAFAVAKDYLEPLDKTIIQVVGAEGDYYCMCLYEYIVTGIYPNTHISSRWHTLAISYKDGLWLIDLSEDWQAAFADKVFAPDRCEVAYRAGRNIAEFAVANYMWMDESLVYDGCSNNEIKFAWQNEDGSVDVAIWFANGTPNNIMYTKINELSISSKDYGTVISVKNADINFPLKAMTGALKIYNIPAEQVKTGTKTWGSLSSHLNVSFE